MSSGELVFVGLGLYDEEDISVKGLSLIRGCDRVFAEFYTSQLVGTNIGRIERLIGKPIEVLSRDEAERGDRVLKSALKDKTVFLTCGDPMIATTHVDLRLRAVEKGIRTRIVHGSSIVTAVPGLLGLQSYKFGRATSLVFPDKNYSPISPYYVVKNNREMGLHTLVFLDIHAEKKRYMTANEGMDILLDMERNVGDGVFEEDSVVCVVARAGSSDPLLRADRICVLREQDFGHPLHTIVVPGRLHFMEAEALVRLAGLPKELAGKLQKL